MEHTTLQGVVALLEGARLHFDIFDSFSIYGRLVQKSAVDPGNISNNLGFHERGVLADEIGIPYIDGEIPFVRGKRHNLGFLCFSVLHGRIKNINYVSCLRIEETSNPFRFCV